MNTNIAESQADRERVLTDRQRLVLGVIRDYIAAHGYPPTLRDIGRILAIRSPNGVLTHIKALEKKGFIRRDPIIGRTIVVLDA